MKTFVMFCFGLLLLSMSLSLIMISYILFDEAYQIYRKKKNSNIDIVKCSDCYWCETRLDGLYCNKHHSGFYEDDYCSYGKRKE